jgi:hypothetical protein
MPATFTPSLTPTFTATTENVCPGGNCAYTCLSKLQSFLNGTGQPLSPPKSIFTHPSRTPEMVTLVTYQVASDQITAPVLAAKLPNDLQPYQADSAAQQKIWNYFAKIIPTDQRKEIKTFMIGTDGPDGILASISLMSTDLSTWQLNVDIVDAADPTTMTYTMLHEFGHLLTLNGSQVMPDLQLLNHPNDQSTLATETATCSQFLTLEGCSKPAAYINGFFQNSGLNCTRPGVRLTQKPIRLSTTGSWVSSIMPTRISL